MQLTGALAVSAMTFALGMRVARHRASASPFDLPVVATVNGVELTQADLKIALVAYRRQAIEDLVTQTLLLQAAQERSLPLPPEATPTPEPGLLPDEALALARQTRSQEIRRRLALAKFSAAERRKAFEAMGSELHRYWLSVIVLKKEDEAPFLQRELSNGNSFESLVSKFSVPVGLPADGRLDEMSRSMVSQRLGPYVAESLPLLKAGQVSQVLPSPLGPVVLKVLRVQRDYGELQDVLDEALVNAESLALDYQMGVMAYVTSPYVPEMARRKPKATASQPLNPDSLKPLAARPARPPLRPEGRPIASLRGNLLKNPPPPLDPKPAPKPIAIKVKSEPYRAGILKATLEKTSHRVLQAHLQKLLVLRLDLNDNHHADDSEPVLVQLTTEGWKPVAELAESVNRFRLEHDYGYWTNPGPNLKIAAEDVKLLGLQPDKTTPNRFEIGVEIFRDDAGRLFQLGQLARYSGRTQVDKQDLLRLRDYRDTNANWTVSEQ